MHAVGEEKSCNKNLLFYSWHTPRPSIRLPSGEDHVPRIRLWGARDGRCVLCLRLRSVVSQLLYLGQLCLCIWRTGDKNPTNSFTACRVYIYIYIARSTIRREGYCMRRKCVAKVLRLYRQVQSRVPRYLNARECIYPDEGSYDTLMVSDSEILEHFGCPPNLVKSIALIAGAWMNSQGSTLVLHHQQINLLKHKHN